MHCRNRRIRTLRLAFLIYFAVRSHRWWRGAHQLVLIPLMVLLPVVVLDILVDKLSEVSLTQRHDSAETFLLDGANEPLGIGIEIGTAREKTHGVDAATPENLLEVTSEQWIAVVKQIP